MTIETQITEKCCDCGRPQPLHQEWLEECQYVGGQGYQLFHVCPNCFDKRRRKSAAAVAALKRVMDGYDAARSDARFDIAWHAGGRTCLVDVPVAEGDC